MDDSLDLAQLGKILLQGKWIITAIAAVFALAAVGYSLLVTPVYRAEAVLSPVTRGGSVASALGGLGQLASLAGLRLDSGAQEVEAIAILGSKEFIRDFIQQENLMPVLFADQWDSQNDTWISKSTEERPDIRDGVELFARRVRSLSEDRRTGLVVLAIEWVDAELAADWARKLIARINERVRQRDIEESMRRLQYLNQQLEAAELVELRQAIASVIEDQIKAMMLAQAQAEYAFRIIDPPIVPKRPVWPKRTLIVAVSTVFGGCLGIFVVLVWCGLKERGHDLGIRDLQDCSS